MKNTRYIISLYVVGKRKTVSSTALAACAFCAGSMGRSPDTPSDSFTRSTPSYASPSCRLALREAGQGRETTKKKVWVHSVERGLQDEAQFQFQEEYQSRLGQTQGGYKAASRRVPRSSGASFAPPISSTRSLQNDFDRDNELNN